MGWCSAIPIQKKGVVSGKGVEENKSTFFFFLNSDIEHVEFKDVKWNCPVDFGV